MYTLQNCCCEIRNFRQEHEKEVNCATRILLVRNIRSYAVHDDSKFLFYISNILNLIITLTVSFWSFNIFFYFLHKNMVIDICCHGDTNLENLNYTMNNNDVALY